MKGILKSKIFLLAAISFIISIYQLVTGKTVDPNTAQEIAAIDWSNVAQAIISLLVILFRVFSSGTKIGGLFSGTLFN